MRAPLYVLGRRVNSVCTLLGDPRQQLELLNPNWLGALPPDLESMYSSALRLLVLEVRMQRRLPAVIIGRPSWDVSCSRLLWIWLLTLSLRLTSLMQKPLVLKTLWNLDVEVSVRLNRLSCRQARILFDGYFAALTRFGVQWPSSLWLVCGPQKNFLSESTESSWNRPCTFLAADVYTATRAHVFPDVMLLLALLLNRICPCLSWRAPGARQVLSLMTGPMESFPVAPHYLQVLNMPLRLAMVSVPTFSRLYSPMRLPRWVVLLSTEHLER